MPYACIIYLIIVRQNLCARFNVFYQVDLELAIVSQI
jgi:hypothetical protein